MMPIGKVICSSSFTATTRYVLEKEQAQWLDGTMLGANAKELVQEFEFSRRNNLAIERPCLHLILSYSKTDEQRQHLDNELLAAIAQEHFVGCAVLSRWHRPLVELDPEVYRQQLETFKEEELHHYQMFSAVHEDVHHRHTHTVGSRINVLDGKCLETWQNRLKSQYVIRELEVRYGLEINQSSGEKNRRGLSRRQLEKQSETGRKPVQLELQETLDATLPQVKTLDGLVDALRESGVDMRLYQRETGELYGVSYAKDGVAFRGSALGKKYSFKGLEKSLGQSLEAIAPALILESVTKPAVEPALIRAFEPQPAVAVERVLEAIQPPDPLELIKQQQQQQEQAIKAARELEAVALELAGFLKQKKINFYKGNLYTFGFTEAQQQRLVCQQNEDQALVFEAVLRQGKWMAIAGQVPPEVKQACLDLKQGQSKPAKVPTQNQATV